MIIVGIIPARMASTRFPGKPLAPICGTPMVGHVYLRSRMNKALQHVYVATCDKEIEGYCLKNNIPVVMTKDSHTRASDRAAEAMVKIEGRIKKRLDIVVMIQGDEPLLHPGMIDASLEPLSKDSGIMITNLMAKIRDASELNDPNVVKVVVDKDQYALYFSREAIPSLKKTKETVAHYKQVPIIPFRRDFLIVFNELSHTPLEIIESVDMLRLLEHGYKVKMVLSEFNTYGVDTQGDLKMVERAMRDDLVFLSYADKKLNGAGYETR